MSVSNTRLNALWGKGRRHVCGWVPSTWFNAWHLESLDNYVLKESSSRDQRIPWSLLSSPHALVLSHLRRLLQALSESVPLKVLVQGTFSANGWQLLQFFLTLLRLPYSLPTQDPSTEIKLCRQTPQGLLKDIPLLGENDFIDFSALGEHKAQLSVQDVWTQPELGLAEAVFPCARQRAAANTTLGPSFQLPHHPGHASQWGETGLHPTAGLIPPTPGVESGLPGMALKGLVLWPILYFHLCPHTVSVTCLEYGWCLIHSHRDVRKEFSLPKIQLTHFLTDGLWDQGDCHLKSSSSFSEPPACVLSLSAHEHLPPAGMASTHIAHHHLPAWCGSPHATSCLKPNSLAFSE